MVTVSVVVWGSLVGDYDPRKDSLHGSKAGGLEEIY